MDKCRPRQVREKTALENEPAPHVIEARFRNTISFCQPSFELQFVLESGKEAGADRKPGSFLSNLA